MDIILTPAEVRQFKDALLSSFERGSLEQVVFYGLGVRLTNIVQASNFDNEVNDLVMWVNGNNKVAALLKEAREENPGNPKLREFDAYIKAKQEEKQVGISPVADPLKGSKAQLIDELSKLSVAETFQGRTSLLDGIPGADSILNRDSSSKRLDLDLIITQLTQLGRLAGGESPFIKLIDNALPYAKGFEPEGKLRAIRQKLAQE